MIGKKLILLFILTLVPLSSLPAFAAPQSYKINPARAQVSFTANSTLHKIYGNAAKVDGAIVFDMDLLETIEMPKIHIPIQSLETGNEARDEAMYRMFDAMRFPEIRWEATKLSCLGQALGRPVNCHAEGYLEIRDARRPVSFIVEIVPGENGVRTQGQLTLSLRDYDLHPPSVLGIIKVSDEVNLHFDVVWTLQK